MKNLTPPLPPPLIFRLLCPIMCPRIKMMQWIPINKPLMILRINLLSPFLPSKFGPTRPKPSSSILAIPKSKCRISIHSLIRGPSRPTISTMRVETWRGSGKCSAAFTQSTRRARTGITPSGGVCRVTAVTPRWWMRLCVLCVVEAIVSIVGLPL